MALYANLVIDMSVVVDGIGPNHDDVIKWKIFHVSGPLWGPHKGQCRRALCFLLSAPEQTVE